MDYVCSSSPTLLHLFHWLSWILMPESWSFVIFPHKLLFLWSEFMSLLPFQWTTKQHSRDTQSIQFILIANRIVNGRTLTLKKLILFHIISTFRYLAFQLNILLTEEWDSSECLRFNLVMGASWNFIKML